MIQFSSGAGIQFGFAGIEQYITERQHQSAWRRGRLQLIDFRLQASRLFIGLSSLFIGSSSLLVGFSGLNLRVLCLVVRVLDLAITGGQLNLAAFRLAGRDPGIVGLCSCARLRKPRVLRGEVSWLSYVRLPVIQRCVLGDVQLLLCRV